MELNTLKLKELEKGPEPFFKVYKYCAPGKDPEKVKLWTTDVCEEMEHAIDQRYNEMIAESKKGSKKHRRKAEKELSKNLPALDYDLPPLSEHGPPLQGVTAPQAANQGDSPFRSHSQFHLPPPPDQSQEGPPNNQSHLPRVPLAE